LKRVFFYFLLILLIGCNGISKNEIKNILSTNNPALEIQENINLIYMETLITEFTPTVEKINPLIDCDFETSLYFNSTEGEIIFCDSFLDNKNNWSIGEINFSDSYIFKEISNGYLRIFFDDNSGYGYVDNTFLPNIDINNVFVEISFKFISGCSECEMGVSFAFDNNYYYFSITNNGYYRFRRLYNNNWDDLIINNLPSLPTAEPSISIRYYDGSFMFYVDNEYIDSFDIENTRFNNIGLLIGIPSYTEAEYLFDNLIIKEIK